VGEHARIVHRGVSPTKTGRTRTSFREEEDFEERCREPRFAGSIWTDALSLSSGAARMRDKSTLAARSRRRNHSSEGNLDDSGVVQVLNRDTQAPAVGLAPASATASSIASRFAADPRKA
jgi:hypothetical protein